MAEATEKQQALSRYGMLKSERASWFLHWQEITTYLLPRNGRYFVQDRNKGWRRHNSIYDSRATRALKILGAGLMGGLTSPARPWFRLGTMDPELREWPAVKEWLADCTRIMLDIFQRSNTYRALHQQYLELGAFGTAADLVADNFDTVIHHHPLTIGEYVIAQDYQGRITTLHREFERTVVEIVKEFGYDNCSQTVRGLYDRGTLDTWVPMLHIIEPRADRDRSKPDAKNMAWKSCIFELNGDSNDCLRESGYKQFPVLVPRWDVAGGDVYGNSPGMEALGDIKQLQQEQLRKSQGIDYMTNPPIQVPTALKNREVQRLPGGVTYYDSNQGTQGIKPMFEVRLDLNHLLADIQDVRSRIDGAFYADLFLMLSNQPADGRMTATEVAERHEEKMLMLGPVLERLHDELLSPMIDRTFQRMIETGIVPPAPEELHGQQVNVELVSMLAQAQRAIATNSIDRFVGSIGAIAAFKPEIVDKLDTDAYVDAYSDMLGVDPKLVIANDKVALIRQQRAQQQQQMVQAQTAEQNANAAHKLANSPTQGGSSTALDDVVQQFSGYGG